MKRKPVFRSDVRSDEEYVTSVKMWIIYYQPSQEKGCNSLWGVPDDARKFFLNKKNLRIFFEKLLKTVLKYFFGKFRSLKKFLEFFVDYLEVSEALRAKHLSGFALRTYRFV